MFGGGSRLRRERASPVATKLHRPDSGLKWNKLVEGVAMAGDEVEITLQIESDLAE